VWDEIIRLLEDPALIQSEIDRRRTIARNTDPFRQRQQELRGEQMRIEKNSERLLTAYQEGLVTLPQLRQRMPALQKQAQAIGTELTARQRVPTPRFRSVDRCRRKKVAVGEVIVVRYADDRAPRAQRAEEGPMCVTA
jgi:hypothetical protein